MKTLSKIEITMFNDFNFTIVVAISENNAIGKNNELLWHISGDLKRFKEITTGHTVIMGKNTYLSLPKRPLPNRKNVVVSSKTEETKKFFPEIDVVANIEEALQIADSDKENFIIGGGAIYKDFLPLSNKIYLTIVHEEYEADVFFPEINYEEWNIVEKEEHLEHEPKFTYLTLTRK
ncbi:dihydrofolate reductase [Bacteroidales bacterium OttesenSCG-928-I21]|nr:dihydrofolate reductase [Bacteroidales bacterium OttesenSCG-928-I21]